MDWIEAANKYKGILWANEIKGRAGDPAIFDKTKLVKVSGQMGLIEPAAKSFNRMRQAVGDKWSFQCGPSMWRDYNEELRICGGTGRTTRCDGVNKATAGGSIHGWGRAVDFTLLYTESKSDNRCAKCYNAPKPGTNAYDFYLWLQQNAFNYGWVNYLREPWHWEYVGEPPGKYDNPAVTNPTGKTPPEPGGIFNETPSGDDNFEKEDEGTEARPEQSYNQLLKELSILIAGGTIDPASGSDTPKESKETETVSKPDIETMSEPTLKQDKISVDLTPKKEDEEKGSGV